MTPPNYEQQVYVYIGAVKSMLDAVDGVIPQTSFKSTKDEVDIKACCEIAVLSCKAMLKLMDEAFARANAPSRCG